MRYQARSIVALLTLGVLLACSPQKKSSPAEYDSLVELFRQWREFQKPTVTEGVPDYSPAAMAEQKRRLPEYQSRLAAIDPTEWPLTRRIDYDLVRAEMNGLDFDHRVLRPWSRNPAFYNVLIPSQSDTPAKEGPLFHGSLEPWRYQFPLRDSQLTDFRTKLAAIPRILEQARRNLVENARDLWFLGIRLKREESAGLETLSRRLSEQNPELLPEVELARKAVDEFRAWLEERLPEKTGPSGIGIDNYDWYLRNVHLVPYTWKDVAILMQRELARSRTQLALEEHKDRSLPHLEPIATEEEYARRLNDAVSRFIEFLRAKEILTVAPYMDTALRARIGRFSPPGVSGREFFSEVDYRDPLMMRVHGVHWFDTARLERDPHESPIRRVPLLYNIWDTRSEGLATGMEEMMMHAGLFEGQPRSRELICILLAQRAARALGDLKMHSGEFTLEQAVRFSVENTPRGWLREDGETVWGEMHLYLEQPAYGISYLVGKLQIDELIAERSRRLGDAFSLKGFMDEFYSAGMIPVSRIACQMAGIPCEPVTDSPK